MDDYGMYVRDDHDHNRVFTGFLEGQYSFELYDKNRTNRLAIGQHDDSGDSGVTVRDEKGVVRLGLGQTVNSADGLRWWVWRSSTVISMRESSYTIPATRRP